MGRKVYTSKSSIKIFEDNTDDVIKKANIRAVLKFVQGTSWYSAWTSEFFLTKGMFEAIYRWGLLGQTTGGTKGYYLGLPSSTFRAVDIDTPAIEAALVSALGGGPYTVLEVTLNNLPINEYWHSELQAAPYFYSPSLNQLTIDGKTDWHISTIRYEGRDELRDEESGAIIGPAIPFGYRLYLKRQDKDVKVWLEGPSEIREGDSVEFTVRSNTPTPRTASITIELNYGGTADSSRYTGPATVTIPEYSKEATFTVTADEDAAEDGNATITITLGACTDDIGTFRSIVPWTPHHTVSLDLLDNDTLTLGMTGQRLSEVDLTEITIPVVLSADAAAAFTVEAQVVNGTAVQGIDFSVSAGNPATLNFAGIAGEVQNLVVSWIGDVPDSDTKVFTVHLTNCSDPAIVLLGDITVTIFPSVFTEPFVTGSVWENNDDSVPNLGTPLIEFDDPWMVIRYHATADNENEWYYWLYNQNSNTYPAIHPVFFNKTIDDMYPVGVIRRQKAFVDTNKSAPAYTSTNALLKRMQLSVDTFVENLQAQAGYQDVDDAFVNLAMSPLDQDPIISKLLFRHFYNLIVTLNLNSATEVYQNYFVQQDTNNLTEWRDHSITYNILGTIPNGTGVGSYSHTVDQYQDGFLQQPPWWGLFDDDTNDNPPPTPRYSDRLSLYYQNTETTYTKIKVINLTATSRIVYAGITRYVTHPLTVRQVGLASFGQRLEDPQYCTIPLYHSLIRDNLTLYEMMKVWKYIVRVDIYSIQIVKTKWYQSSFFKALFTFAAVVITFVSAGAGSGTFSILSLLTTITVNALILKLVVYVAEETGSTELAAIVGIVAVVAFADLGYISGFEFGSAEMLTSSVSNFANLVGAAFEGEQNRAREDLAEVEAEVRSLEEIIDEQGNMGQSPVTGEFYQALLRSADTVIAAGRDVQYNFDAVLGGSYDQLIHDFHDNLLRSGVV
jgi:hypothetical protein